MRLFKEKDGECDILVVHAEREYYAVAAPAGEAVPGYLVAFRVADKMTMVGQVTNLIRCNQFDDTWHTVATFTRIHDAVAIYSVVWSEEDADT